MIIRDGTPSAAIWTEISSDAVILRDFEDPLLGSLWSSTPLDWFTSMDQKTRTIWAADPDTWAFWLRWWDGVLAGKPLDWELQKEVALIPDAVWKEGPKAVAGAIAGIEDKIALVLTDNAEAIEPDPLTGRLALKPTSALPDEILGYARRKIMKAVGLFDASPSLQMYGGLSVDLVMLQEAVADTGNMPVELYDACASASRRVVIRAGTGDCPPIEKDPILGDYLSRLRETGADILAHDPQTQAVLERRNAIIGNTALIDEGPQIVAVTQLLVVITSGHLATALPLDAALATDPKADPEERKAATYRWVGRVLRISKWVVGVPAGLGASVVFAAEVLQAIPIIQASPYYQTALAAIMRWLGMA